MPQKEYLLLIGLSQDAGLLCRCTFSISSRTKTVVQCLGKLVEHIGIHKVIAVALLFTEFTTPNSELIEE
jgi:hypothetical protein